MELLVTFNAPVSETIRTVLGREARRVTEAVGAGGYEISLVFVVDAQMRTLNRTYRGIDRATDVLAFPQYDREELHSPGPGGDGRPRPLGDVVISMETARGQAVRLGTTFEEEVRRLLAHGMLHLLGYDHEDPSDAEVMRLEEESVLRRAESGAPG